MTLRLPRENVPEAGDPWASPGQAGDPLCGLAGGQGEAIPDGRVAVLLSTYNGAPFVAAQLHSLLAQTHHDWVLFWRDDGSSDGTQAIVTEFLAGLPPDRATSLPQDGRVGSGESFMRLLQSAGAAGYRTMAFADQDDIWLPDKLARGLGRLQRISGEAPALYCARQMLVDTQLHPIALSRPLRQPPGFPAALTQNIAAGCTAILNGPAAALVGQSRRPAACMHDWWCYLVVAGAGGQVVVDEQPVLLYRQHAGNLVGASSSSLRRGIAALRRGPRMFMQMFRQNVAALADQSDLLAPSAAAQVVTLDRALQGGRLRRLRALRMPGLARQTLSETLLFRLWFLLG